MHTRTLGYTGVELTTVGLGTWAIGGGGWKFGWGPQDDDQSISTIHQALDLGINWIDTARIYGLGHSETVVGEAIKGRDVFVATKCGRQWRSNGEIYADLTEETVRRECESSLRRLGRDVIDLYQIHWPDPESDIEEGWSAVARLIEEGKVRFGGVCNFSVAQLDRIREIHPVASLQPPYNMLNRRVEAGLLDYCARHEIGVVAYSPMLSGLLTGKYTEKTAASLPDEDWRKRSPHFLEPELSVNVTFVERLKALADGCGLSVAQLTIAWVLRRPEVTSAIVGARKAEQIVETAPAGDAELSREALEEIEHLLQWRKEAIAG